MDETSNSESRKSIKTGNILYVIIIVFLILLNIWFAYKIQLLEKSVTNLQNQTKKIERDISIINYDVDNIYSAVSRNSSRLDYVIPLAENANSWAHSHGW